MGAAILPTIVEVFGMPVTGVDNGMMACGLTLRISTPVVQATPEGAQSGKVLRKVAADGALNE